MMSLKLLCEDTTSFQKLKKTIDIIALTYEVLCAFGEDFIVFVWSFVIFASLLVKYLSAEMMG